MDGLAASEKDVQVEKATVEEKLRELKEQRADIEEAHTARTEATGIRNRKDYRDIQRLYSVIK